MQFELVCCSVVWGGQKNIKQDHTRDIWERPSNIMVKESGLWNPKVKLQILGPLLHMCDPGKLLNFSVLQLPYG